MRKSFLTIVDGWSRTNDVDDLSDRIERSSKWVDANGPLLGDEVVTIRLMIQCQIAMKVRRGDFEPFIPADTDPRDVLDFCTDGHP